MTWTVATETIGQAGVLSTPLEPAEEPYAIIPLHGKYGQGKVAKVSLQDVARVRRHRWYGDPYGYAHYYKKIPGIKRTFEVVKMHRYILRLAKYDGKVTDHRHGDRLDNRRSKIRKCVQRQNAANKRSFRLDKSSKYKGVSFGEGAWRASIKADDVSYGLGVYKTEVEAAQAYDKAARYHFGEFALTNFPGTEAESAESIQRTRILEARARQESNYLGVMFVSTTFSDTGGVWKTRITSGREKHDLGRYASEKEAARVYDSAALFLFGPDAKVNFEDSTPENPESIIARYRLKPLLSKLGTTSRYRGVCWNKKHKAWAAKFAHEGKRSWLGRYKIEEDAAQAYDNARAAHGLPKVNFPDQAKAA